MTNDLKTIIQVSAANMQGTAELLDNLVADIIKDSWALIQEPHIDMLHDTAAYFRQSASLALLRLEELERRAKSDEDHPF